MLAPRPELCAAALEAAHCWRWCDGWNPAAWPAYGALHPVADWSLLIDLLEVIREALH